MIDLLLFVGIPVLIGAGSLAWKYRPDQGSDARLAKAGRRREDARDWQRRFGLDSPLAASFFPPTQNEILETLYVLDHLAPGWEEDETALVENSFLNELALNFPTLCKPDHTFPRDSLKMQGTSEIDAKREAFRARRAQINALDQIISGTPAPDDLTSDGPLDRQTPDSSTRLDHGLWPAVLGGLAVLIAVALFGARSLPHPVNVKVAEQTVVQPSTPPEIVAAEATPLPSADPEVEVPGAAPISAPSPTVSVVEKEPSQRPPILPPRATDALDQKIAASKERAVAKYPALAVEGSEINLRFVFRYKTLVQQNSPRLLDPNWPEQLVEECAAAAGVSPKRDGFTRVLGTPR